jgi:hypothetical protein
MKSKNLGGTMKEHVWLPWRRDPILQDSEDNPFIREHLPSEDIRLLQRASRVRRYMAHLVSLSLGIMLGLVFGLNPVVQRAASGWEGAWLPISLGAVFLVCRYFERRASRRIDAFWNQALNDHKQIAPRP